MSWPTPYLDHRPIRRAGRGYGEAVLPQVYGRLHTQVLQTSPHRRRLLRHRLPAHVVHGAPRVQAQEAGQPVRSQVRGDGAARSVGVWLSRSLLLEMGDVMIENDLKPHIVNSCLDVVVCISIARFGLQTDFFLTRWDGRGPRMKRSRLRWISLFPTISAAIRAKQQRYVSTLNMLILQVICRKLWPPDDSNLAECLFHTWKVWPELS